MISFHINETDKNWLSEKYPGLESTFENDIQILSGEFYFDAIYENHRITDSYQIRIEFQTSAISNLPRVREIGSRIQRVTKSRNVSLADLHIYKDGTVCLCVKLAEVQYFPSGFHIQKFIEDLVVPFFYAESYFEQMRVWPWETYSHGSLGWLEWYFDQDVTSPQVTSLYLQELRSQNDWRRIHRALTRNGGPKSYRVCFCGSSKSYWNCHRTAFRGLRRLAGDIKAFKIKV